MIPANKIKDISSKIHCNIGDSEKLPSAKPLIIGLLICLALYLLTFTI